MDLLPAAQPIEIHGHNADGQSILLGARCRACDGCVFPFSHVCPVCMSEDMRTEQLPRTGTLYSFTALHVGPADWEKPFTVGYVDLSNGTRVFSHLKSERPFEIGDAVELAADDVRSAVAGGGKPMFVFQPVAY
jgi:uncharacterized OB-fold protein